MRFKVRHKVNVVSEGGGSTGYYHVCGDNCRVIFISSVCLCVFVAHLVLRGTAEMNTSCPSVNVMRVRDL